MSELFVDKELGNVYIKRNSRAKNIIARKRSDFIELTVPIGSSMKQIMTAFEQMKPRLLTLKVKPQNVLDTSSILETMAFSLRIENRDVRNFHASLKDNILHIVCPNINDFADITVQATLKNTIEQVMRGEAKRIFPFKLSSLAKLHGFDYKGLSINKSRTRWGSCSSQKSINLSYFCLFLPEYLIDFVILHELCHTIEMNHGEKFWKLLDAVTGDKARQLTLELKRVSIPW